MPGRSQQEEDRHRSVNDPALRCARGLTPANVALAHMIMTANSAEDVSRALDMALRRHRLPRGNERFLRLERMRELWDGTPDAYRHVKSVMRTFEHIEATDSHPAPHIWGTAFDSAVSASGDASVALYCLGRADLLRAATDEIVQLLQSWELLAPEAVVLDLGCGSGRIAETVSRHVRTVIGLDISMGMLKAARERCLDRANSHFVLGSGRDLATFSDGCLDAIVAVDVFPYLVMSGIAQRQIEEAARVLRHDGHLLILNFAYGRDATANARELQRLAGDAGFSLRHSAVQAFSVWDGSCFLLRKSTAQERSI
jgi:2-polyprenyl-3-methyl-5-hydroxy-6-metoxy-1,4-benzoquinol methylase